MEPNKVVTDFQRECYAQYLDDIRKKVPQFPAPYLYPDGNPIRPVVPVQTTLNKIMLVGAYPSARFERRQGMLIPVGDNLAPFGPETYFDGREVRRQASTESLQENYFPQLGITRRDLWITDIVKIYLYPEKHLKNCRALFPSAHFTETHSLFPKIAAASFEWFKRELEVCKPRLIITLGDVAAQVVAQAKQPCLDGVIRDLPLGNGYKIVHLAHPEARRRFKSWDEKTAIQLRLLSKQVKNYL